MIEAIQKTLGSIDLPIVLAPCACRCTWPDTGSYLKSKTPRSMLKIKKLHLFCKMKQLFLTAIAKHEYLVQAIHCVSHP